LDFLGDWHQTKPQGIWASHVEVDSCMKQTDRIAIVTGTSSGIGAAIADSLLEHKWGVIGISRRHVDIENAAYQHLQLDLADLESLTEIANEQLEPILKEPRWQRVGLVNNAATIGALRPIEEIDPSHFARVFRVNAIAPIYLMGFVTRGIPNETWLRIVNISTGAAVQGVPGLGDYGSSKAALRMAGMVLAAELHSEERPGGRRPNTAMSQELWTHQCR
jgi:NAD(P)-dependent dehydrogenase (short-subunit alcohol dehydrogenase family)